MTPSTLTLALGIALFGALATAPAAAAVDAGPAAVQAESFSLHGQFTHVTQRNAAFRSPYEGANSLPPQAARRSTHDLTLFAAVRLWPGASMVLNPEIDQGFGLGNTLGLAGFSSGEAYKVGAQRPYLRLQRAYLRQVWPQGPATETVAAAPNALAGVEARDQLVLTVGKFSVVDVFDNNRHAHDPRADFLNWAVLDAGAFDYAADAWGYTRGAALERQGGDWTLRAGVFALPEVPNSVHLDAGFGQRSWVLEAEHRHRIGGQDGALRLLAYGNRARMGRYEDAVALAQRQGGVADTAAVRRRASQHGVALNAEQALAADVGVFARVSANAGTHEAFAFTEINRSSSAGIVLGGARWGRPTHRAGLALAVNGISGAARRYFDAGGLGILIGDGRLPQAGPEQIAEFFYRVDLGQLGGSAWTLTGDLQRIRNPAYNRQRGPVDIAGLRLHAAF